MDSMKITTREFFQKIYDAYHDSRGMQIETPKGVLDISSQWVDYIYKDLGKLIEEILSEDESNPYSLDFGEFGNDSGSLDKDIMDQIVAVICDEDNLEEQALNFIFDF